MDAEQLKAAVAKYAKAKHALATKKKEIAEEEKPFKQSLAEIKKKYEYVLSLLNKDVIASHTLAMIQTANAKSTGLFGKKARLPLDGIGYAEVQKPKYAVQVVDLDAFLASDFAPALITGVSIDESAALRLFDRKPIPGLDVVAKTPVIKFSTSKWKPEEEA